MPKEYFCKKNGGVEKDDGAFRRRFGVPLATLGTVHSEEIEYQDYKHVSDI